MANNVDTFYAGRPAYSGGFGGFSQLQPYLSKPPKHQFQDFMSAGLAGSGVGVRFRKDSQESVFFRNQLESIWSRAYDVRKAPLQGRLFVPKDTETAPWAEVYRYSTFDHVGAAVLLKTYSEEVPSCDVAGKEVFGRVWGYGTKFGWAELEALQAQANARPLPTEKQGTSRRILEERVDDTIAVGDPDDFNSYGLLNNPNVPVLVLPVGASGFPQWDKKTGLEVVNDLSLIVSGIRRRTSEVERGDTLVIPPGALTYISTTPMSKELPNISILEYFLSKNQDIAAVQGWYRANTAGAGGTPRGVCYFRNEDNLRAILPLEYTMLPPQRSGFRMDILAHIRVGGVQWMFPLSAVYFDDMISASYLTGG